MEISDVEGTVNQLLVDKLSSINLSENPFKSKLWCALSMPSELFDDGDEIENRYSELISVKVSGRPKNATYLFAVDKNGKDYFLHFDNFKDGGWKEWCQLSTGCSLEVLPDENADPSKRAVNAREIYQIF